jgi:hypothetical protein
MTMRIIILDGNEWQVPLEHDEKTVRDSLVSAGFPNAATAEVKPGTKTIDGQEYETWEFIKKVGTKGS